MEGTRWGAMGGSWRWHWSLWLLNLWLLASSAFNLDATSSLLKDGDKGSLFGFSVALHRQLSPEPAGWLLVGAPQAPALPSQGANRTGGLFACPLTPELSDCWRVPIDEGVDLERESKENQWLGVSVKSQGAGGKIVTCAHLYETRHRVRQPLETRDVIGRCFVLSQDLRVRDELDGGEWKFCQGRPQGHDRFGSCQQGLAAAFSPDHHYILFGAPGTYNWKGNLRVELLNQSSLDPLRYDDGPYEAGGEKDQDPSLIPVPANSYLGLLFVTNIDSSDPDQLVYKTPQPNEKVPGAAGDVAQNSYLGFSVDAGAGLTRRRELSFVTGAPRANHTGAVLILRRDSANRLVPEAVLPGQQLTSAFGYAVAVLDLNSDGWMDLVVGAPHFFERKEEIGGAAYVYINPAGRWDAATPLRLNGTRGSMFGIALSAAGDLNHDGFEDLAVGAPFDGAGKVYIYHGSNLGIVAKPAQVLDGEGVGVTAFGYSLSGGLDVDGNLYPDLLVGSLSDTVVLYRARPVVHVSRNVSLVPPNIDLEQSNCQHQEGVCVDVRACFSYTASPGSYSPRLVLQYVFDADTDRRRRGQAPRVAFLGRRPSDPEHQFSSTVELPRQRARVCVTATFQLQDSIRDKLRPIAVTLAYGIQEAGATRQSRGTTLPPLLPVLSPQQPSSHRAEVHFLKQGCGDDKICQSNLQLHFQFCARLGDADFLPLPRGEDGTAIFSMSDQKDVALEIHVTNLPSDPEQPQRDGDDAHEALLTVTFPPELPYSALRPYDGHTPGDKAVLCLANQNGSQVECELGNPMKRGAQVRFFLILSTVGITIQTTDLAVELALSTISEQPGLEPVVARARVVIELPLSVTGVAVPPRLFFGGVVRGESAVRRESQVGSAVRLEVTVSNRGQSLRTLGSAFLTLLWPHEISNGKWLLYPLHLELGTPPGQRVACSPPANPLRLALEPLGEADPAEVPTPGSWWVPAPAERRRNVTLDCAQGTARCLAFRCPLHSFERAAVLTARGRLWNGTFLEEYLAVTSVELIVRASVSVTSSIKNLVLKDASTQVCPCHPGVPLSPSPSTWTPGRRWRAECPGGSSCWPCWPASSSWPCSSSSSGSAASSSGAAGSPATPLIITGPAWGCSRPRRTSRRRRASGDAGLPRPSPGGHRGRVCAGVRGPAACPGVTCGRARRSRGGRTRGCSAGVRVCKGLQCPSWDVQGLAVLVHECAKGFAVLVCEGLQCPSRDVRGFAVLARGFVVLARGFAVLARGFAVLAHDGASVCGAGAKRSPPAVTFGVSAAGWASARAIPEAGVSPRSPDPPGCPHGALIRRSPVAGFLPPRPRRAAGRAAVPRREDPAGGAAAVPRGEDGHDPEEGVGGQPEGGQRRPRGPQLGVAPGDGGAGAGDSSTGPSGTVCVCVRGGTRVCRHTPA